MIGTWLRDIERIKLATVGQGARVVGVVSPLPGAGVSTLARELAEVTARSGKRTILVDLTQRIGSAASPLGWHASLTLVEATYPATLAGVRGLRTELSRSLDAMRLTRPHARDVALAVSEIAALVVRSSGSVATHLAVCVRLEDAQIIVELVHDGAPVLSDSALAAPQSAVPIAADDPTLGLALARTLLAWSSTHVPDHRTTLTATRALSPVSVATSEIVCRPRGAFDELTAAPDATTKLLFNNIELLRTVLHTELAMYEAVFVDLPPLLEDAADRVNPLAAATACDALLLVCLSGELNSAELAHAMTILKRAGITATGVVLNDLMNPTLGEEMAREARRLERVLPSLSRWLSSKALRSRFLDRVSS